ncbi:MAG TPA: hypothetical protein VK961_16370 [Chthoniobacter sp.]|nr:hypothetical protein [Chthoniobacter sp.]
MLGEDKEIHGMQAEHFTTVMYANAEMANGRWQMANFSAAQATERERHAAE